ncbi:Uncharacterised protein [Streptococcus pneumoniae]|nr:Uncharacterised protein [Streptococcus pneumoniae]VNT84030.1 Uncharacterised protein [Streptococcus pneumoniae]VNY00208.1 Uncharacterised protein [Streptococcus pneumoniae]VPE43921.1 Uncharacterised protein [Streptococcus pneumoniae]VRD35369.1 Uncharacterised protein [Streptococcus pneumoniae]
MQFSEYSLPILSFLLLEKFSTRVQIRTRALPFCLYSSKISSNHVNVALDYICD